jgi:phosphohistidine phosphatase
MAQFAILVHHGEAVSSDIDHTRPLSARGRAQAESVAKQIAEHGAKPELIWHSGKLRARQTAEACWRAANPFALFTAARGLQPDDDPDTIAVALTAESRDVLIATHMPLLPMLLHRLTTGRRDLKSASFPVNGAVALERNGDAWIEAWRVAPETS